MTQSLSALFFWIFSLLTGKYGFLATGPMGKKKVFTSLGFVEDFFMGFTFSI